MRVYLLSSKIPGRMSLINEIKQKIKEDTAELSTLEYMELMRELSIWAEDEANLAEYGDDYPFGDE